MNDTWLATSDFHVIVVGGGIGGCATAVALEKLGADVTILEQAQRLSDVGAGVWLTANALKVLDHLGAGPHIRATSVAGESHGYRSLDEGRRLFSMALGDEAEARYGAPTYYVHRADLMTGLTGQLRKPPQLDARVVAISHEPDGAVVSLDTGEMLRADLVIGADGLKSVVREQLFGTDEPRFSGRLSWRSLIPMEKLEGLHLPTGHFEAWTGPERSAVCYPMRDHTIYNFVGFVPAEEVTRESWVLSGDVDDLKRSFSGACADFQAVVDAIDEAFVTGLYFRDPLDKWNVGRVVLLGDAAHPALPTVGQGAAMALEDAVVLANLLADSPQSEVDSALEMFADRRKIRAGRVLSTSRANGAMLGFKDDDLVKARDGRFQGLQVVDPDAHAMYGWLWDYEALRESRNSSPLARRVTERTRPEARRAAAMWRSLFTPEDRSGGWCGERAAYDRFWLSAHPVRDDVVAAQTTLGGVPTQRVAMNSSPSNTHVLHLHGGGYVLGSARGSVEFASRVAAAAGGVAWAVDYRLAPEHPFPAAIDDALAAYEGLLLQHPEFDIVVSGDGSGAGLALALCRELKARGTRMPKAIYALSPMADLTMTHREDTVSDDWHSRDDLAMLSASYTQGHDPNDPRVSPLSGDLAGFPPLLIHSAADEVLAVDARRIVEAARASGVEVQAREFEDTVHAFALFPFLPEAESALQELREFLQ